MPQLLRAAVLISLLLPVLEAQGRSYGRSNVINQQGIVASSQVLAESYTCAR